MLAREIERLGVPPELIELEVTESTLMANPEQAHQMLAKARKQGIQIAVDDFGTGYSSFAYLRDLPVDTLKIDRSFVARACEHVKDRAIVGAVAKLGHDLGLEVVAEGVEDQATEDYLAEIGCDTIQGYHLSRPQPFDAISEWLSRQPNSRWSPIEHG